MNVLAFVSRIQQASHYQTLRLNAKTSVIVYVIQTYMGQGQSFGPNSPVGPAGARPGPVASAAPRPLPLPPPPAPEEIPAGLAVPHRLQTPRKAKLTLEQLLKPNV